MGYARGLIKAIPLTKGSNIGGSSKIDHLVTSKETDTITFSMPDNNNYTTPTTNSISSSILPSFQQLFSCDHESEQELPAKLPTFQQLFSCDPALNLELPVPQKKIIAPIDNVDLIS